MWMICLRTHDTLKELFTRIHDLLETFERAKDLEVETHQEQIQDLLEKIESYKEESRVKFADLEFETHQEQIHDLLEKIESYKEESRVKFADLEVETDSHQEQIHDLHQELRKDTYHVIELKNKNNTMTKQLEALQSWVDLYRKTRGI
jgi:chromosome segregation ATPase